MVYKQQQNADTFLSPCSRRKDTAVALSEGYLFVIGACVFIHRPK